jgi:hypothetical protein
MRNGDVLHNENLTSHEDIKELFNLNDNGMHTDRFVKVEFCPDDNSDLANIERYRLNVDENSTPEWFEQHRQFVTEKLTDIVRRRIISGEVKILVGGLYVVKDAQIGRVQQAKVVYMQNSSVNVMRENSSVNEMWGNSSVNVMRENSSVNEMWENSSVNVMRGNSSVNVMRENSSVNEMRGNSSVNVMRENSSVNEMRENSSVNVMLGNSSVNMMLGNSSVNDMWENSKAPKQPKN